MRWESRSCVFRNRHAVQQASIFYGQEKGIVVRVVAEHKHSHVHVQEVKFCSQKVGYIYMHDVT